MGYSAPRTVWTAGTVFLLVVCLVGTGFYVYGTKRYGQEQAASEALRMEVATLRATQARLEKSVAHLDLLPPLAQAQWEKVLTDQINSAAVEAGVLISSLTYSSHENEKDSGLGAVAFSLELEGSAAALAHCLVLLEEGVSGMRFEGLEGVLSAGDAYYVSLLAGTSGLANRMRITGTVYRETGGPS